jgi:hypothetical protein
MISITRRAPRQKAAASHDIATGVGRLSHADWRAEKMSEAVTVSPQLVREDRVRLHLSDLIAGYLKQM